MPFIQIKTGPNKGKVYEIRDNVITVGRDENQTIQILDQGVSRAHAEIFRMGDMAFVRDLNSTNGTFVNNAKTTEEVLKPGDELLIGTTILAFEESDPSNQPLPETPAAPAAEAAAPPKAGSIETKPTLRRGDPASAKQTVSKTLAAIAEINQILAQARDLESALRAVVAKVADSVEADHAYLYLPDPDSGKPSVRVSIEQGQGVAEKKASRTILTRVLGTGTPLVTQDAALDGRFNLSESVVLKKIKSVMAIPLTTDGKPSGMLYLHTSKPEKPFRSEELELATVAGLQLSAAVAAGATKRNRDMVRRFYEELWNQRNLSLVEDLLAEDAMFRSSLAGYARGHEGFRAALSSVRASFPDLETSIEEMIAEADKVVVRLTYRGTHKGKLLGVAPTGREVKFSGLGIYRIAAGRIAEAWLMGDAAELLKQLDPNPGMSVDSK